MTFSKHILQRTQLKLNKVTDLKGVGFGEKAQVIAMCGLEKYCWLIVLQMYVCCSLLNQLVRKRNPYFTNDSNPKTTEANSATV